jgi:hypothetical protein
MGVLFRLSSVYRGQKVKKTLQVLVIVGLATVIFLIVWMNRFQYEHAGPNQVLVRINRFNGQECFLRSDGWNSQASSVKEDPVSKYGGSALPKEDWDKYRVGNQTNDSKALDSLMYESKANTCQ